MPSTIIFAKSSLPSSGLVPGKGWAAATSGRTMMTAAEIKNRMERMGTPQDGEQGRLYGNGDGNASINSRNSHGAVVNRRHLVADHACVRRSWGRHQSLCAWLLAFF